MHRREILRAGLVVLAATACGQARPPSSRSTSAEPTAVPSPRATTQAPRVADGNGEADLPGEGSEAPVQETPPADAEPSPATPDPAPPLAASLLCREAWGAAPPGGGGRAHTITGMMVHHTAVPLQDNRQAPARLRSYQGHHQSEGWPDVAYHLGVDRNGNLYELRDHGIAGDTFTEYDPAGWLLVLADGHFDEQAPSAQQLEGVAQLLAWGAVTFDVAPELVAGHRDRAATSCPGEALYRHLVDGSLSARASELVDAGGVRLDRLCGAGADERIAAIEAGSR